MPIPIIYVFRGWQPYLELSVQQARRFNPDADIYHVTGEGSRIAAGAIGVYDTEFLARAREFQAIYRHLSVNPHSFELFCFQRWMIAYELMEAKGLTQAVLMDGDVLLWSELGSELAAYDGYGISWTEPDQPGSVYVADREVLGRLCQHMIDHYVKPNGLSRIQAEYDLRIAEGRPAAITDMSLLTYFREDFPGVVGDMGQVVNGARFDHAMFESDGYLMSNGLKKFSWKDGVPHAIPVDGGSPVRFNSMHFVGKTKGYMEIYAAGRNLDGLAKLQSMPAYLRARIPAAIRRIRGMLGLKGRV